MNAKYARHDETTCATISFVLPFHPFVFSFFLVDVLVLSTFTVGTIP